MHRCFHLVTHETEEMERIIRTYSTSLFKLCLVLLCNQQDAEDVLQETFLRYVSKRLPLRMPHMRKPGFSGSPPISVKASSGLRLVLYSLPPMSSSSWAWPKIDRDILLDVMALPPKYKTVLLLYYLEGYKTDEIARILHISPAAHAKDYNMHGDMLRLEYQRKEPCS